MIDGKIAGTKILRFYEMEGIINELNIVLRGTKIDGVWMQFHFLCNLDDPHFGIAGQQ